METTSANRRIRPSHQQDTRCTASKKQQAIQCAIGATSNGFLRHRFSSLFEKGNRLPEQKKMEREFYNSLSILTSVYGCEITEYKDKPYPHNILLSHHAVASQMETAEQELDISIVQDDDGQVKLKAYSCFDPGTTLYYIPVLPVYKLLQDKKKKKSAELILSVFAYLYHHAGVSYYRDSDTYSYYHYDYLTEYLLECIEYYGERDTNRNFSELNGAAHYGDLIFRKIFNLYHLTHFSERIDGFKPKDTFDWACLKVAINAFKLMGRYPYQRIFRNMENEPLDYDEGVLRSEQYISFIASTEGMLYEQMRTSVNDEFGEYSEMQKPTLTQVFDDSTTAEADGLQFEYLLFPLLEDLCTLLNDIP
jgi:hypothetical protein